METDIKQWLKEIVTEIDLAKEKARGKKYICIISMYNYRGEVGKYNY